MQNTKPLISTRFSYLAEIFGLYRIGTAAESAVVPSAIMVTPEQLRDLRAALEFVESVEGFDWTAHNEERSRTLSARATSLLIPRAAVRVHVPGPLTSGSPV